MKSTIALKIFIGMLVACSFAPLANAQTNGQSSIIEDLQKDKPNEGKIRIQSDAKISALVGKKGQPTEESTGYMKTSGYRINIYSGNNPRQSKEEAFSKERQIKEAFPELTTYITYDSPIWRLKAGDFQSSEEATLFMQQIKKELPSIGKEIYVVSDEIKIPLNN